ncbi:Ig-like domain-containing protein [Hymenobacter weizhouensis]|uniref:Ig-like domain-containing protein n=1 Tax=Hymenobacter sp. YIM 151500-1 TaxID=2987689 RepID=UPI002226563D|nr:Ig-like domain-containing protein [Hymenobacter sp. YIM 151500-1]UYZ62247.1 Ig-like domain-containing protein [Hymenobacter sp. YIM 151500-1]
MLLTARTVSSLVAFTAATLLSGCAAISSPEGGARDTKAPELVRSVPANRARNVRGQEVRLEFSEQVQVKDLPKNLIVAPLLREDNPYKLREERNAVSLVFEKPFEPNTTYSFNFGEAISDITESNVARGAVVSFSTGAQLDSGSVRGSVTDLLSGQPAAGAAVVLYPETDTANVRRGRPTYLARTDKQGAFSLQNLKEGRYRLFALADKNQNTRYDEGERIAYLPEPILVRPGLDTLRLRLTRPDARRPLVTTQKPGPTDFQVSYNEGLTQAQLLPLGAATAPPALTEALLLADKGRTVTLYRTPALAEGRYLLTATDSAGNVGRDTVAVRFQGTAPARRGPAYTVEGTPREVYRQGQVRFQFNEPIQLAAASKSFGTLVEDSVKRRPLRLPQDGTLSPDRRTLAVELNTTARQTVTLALDSTAIRSITGQSLGLRPLRLRVTDQATTGTLSGPISTRHTRYEVQLLDANGQVVSALPSPRGTYRFNHLAPGTYRLRVLIDANQDGRWQGGDPSLRQSAEPMYLLPKPLEIRANWDQVEALQF